MDDPMNTDEFRLAMGDLMVELGPQHRIGGYADPVQGSVEFEVARSETAGGAAYDGDARSAEARRWTLLAQFDTDEAADMTWGDCGALYWLIRPDDLAAGRFDTTRFTMQCD